MSRLCWFLVSLGFSQEPPAESVATVDFEQAKKKVEAQHVSVTGQLQQAERLNEGLDDIILQIYKLKGIPVPPALRAPRTPDTSTTPPAAPAGPLSPAPANPPE